MKRARNEFSRSRTDTGRLIITFTRSVHAYKRVNKNGRSFGRVLHQASL